MEALAATTPRHGEAPAAGIFSRLRSDDALITSFRRGDERAFSVLFERHRSRVLAICLGVLGRREDAEDATQEAFVAAAAAMRERPPDKLGPWLSKIARNSAIDLLRSRRPVIAAADVEPVTDDGPDRQMQRRAELRELLGALQSLPENQRSALVMREMAGCTYSEIAGSLGLDEHAVNGLIARARVSLRQARGSGEVACESVRMRLAAEADGRRRPAEVRRHLRSCSHCREFRVAIRGDAQALRALSPLPAFALWKLAVAARGMRYAVASCGLAGGAGAGKAATVVAVCAVGAATTGGVPVGVPEKRVPPVPAGAAQHAPVKAAGRTSHPGGRVVLERVTGALSLGTVSEAVSNVSREVGSSVRRGARWSTWSVHLAQRDGEIRQPQFPGVDGRFPHRPGGADAHAQAPPATSPPARSWSQPSRSGDRDRAVAPRRALDRPELPLPRVARPELKLPSLPSHRLPDQSLPNLPIPLDVQAWSLDGSMPGG